MKDDNLFIQISYDIAEGLVLTELSSEKIPVKLANEAQEFIFSLPDKAKIKNIRIKPLNCKSFLSINSICLMSEENRLDITAKILYSSNVTLYKPNLFLFINEKPLIYLNDVDPIMQEYDFRSISIKIRYFLLDIKVYDDFIENKLPFLYPKSRSNKNNGNFNILYFSPVHSHPQNHGNKSRIYRFGLKFKELGCKVHYVIHNGLGESSLEELEAMKTTWDTVDEIPLFINKEAVRNDNGIPFDGWYQEGLGEEIGSLCAKYDIDIVLCTYIFSSKLLEYVPGYILKIIDTHDKFGNRFEGLRRQGIPIEFFSCTPEDEGAYLRRADIVIACREEEADYFNKVSGSETAVTIPHLQEPRFLVRDFSRLKNIGIVMSPNYVNLKIIADFIAVINFYIKENSAPFIIHIAGDIKNIIYAQPAHIQQMFYRPYIYLHGFLPNIEELYSKIDLVAAPVTFGTGINIKCVEAMAYGLPLLTTKIGSKGIDTDEPLHKLENIEELVKSLFMLAAEPAGLNLLAASSRAAYSKFYDKSLHNFKTLFNHTKLRNNPQS